MLGSIITAAAGLYGASKTKKAGNQAADAQLAAAQLAKDQFDQSRADMKPWMDMGLGALGKMGAIYGIQPGNIDANEGIVTEGEDGKPRIVNPEWIKWSTQGAGNEVRRSELEREIAAIEGSENLDPSSYGRLAEMREELANLSPGGEVGSEEPDQYLDVQTDADGNIVGAGGQDLSAYDKELQGQIKTGWKQYRTQQDKAIANINAQRFAPSEDAAIPDQFRGDRFDFGAEDLYDDPSYKWRFEQGLKALDRVQAKQGRLGSGNRLIELMNEGQNMASQEYQAAWKRAFDTSNTNYARDLGEYGLDYTRSHDIYNRDKDLYNIRRGELTDKYNLMQDRFKRDYALQDDYMKNLGGIAGTGQTTASSLGNLGSSYANTAGGAIAAAGQARGAAGMGSASIIGNTLANIGRNIGYGSGGGPSNPHPGQVGLPAPF